MERTNSIAYIAKSDAAYDALVAHVIKLGCTATLFAADQTIVVPGKFGDAIDDFIEGQGIETEFMQRVLNVNDWEDNLDEFLKAPNLDADTLREVIRMIMARPAADDTADLRAEIKTLTERKDFLEKDRDMYQKWYREGEAKAGRVRKQVEAISTLLSSIYPQG